MRRSQPKPGRSNMTIRDFRGSSDREAVLECIVALQDHERTIDPAMPPGAAMAEEYLNRLLDRCERCGGRILIASVDREVVGFACVLTAVPPSEPDEPRETYALISDLFVHTVDRGKGVGRRLLEEAEALALSASAGVARIVVLAGNDEARQLYASSGFEEYEIHLVKRLEPDRGGKSSE